MEAALQLACRARGTLHSIFRPKAGGDYCDRYLGRQEHIRRNASFRVCGAQNFAAPIAPHLLLVLPCPEGTISPDPRHSAGSLALQALLARIPMPTSMGGAVDKCSTPDEQRAAARKPKASTHV
jgi:hypothetical protein